MRRSTMTMVDSVVWVDFFHQRLTDDVERLKVLAKAGEVTTGDIILHEVMRGFDDDGRRARVARAFDSLECHAMLGCERALRSADRYRNLRRRGVTVRKPNDAIIASFCIDEGIPLLTSDRDFRGYVGMGLELVT